MFGLPYHVTYVFLFIGSFALNLSVDGNFSEWKSKTKCSVSCGGGVQTLYRLCNNPEPKYGGDDCTGDDIKTRQCNTDPCPSSSAELLRLNVIKTGEKLKLRIENEGRRKAILENVTMWNVEFSKMANLVFKQASLRKRRIYKKDHRCSLATYVCQSNILSKVRAYRSYVDVSMEECVAKCCQERLCDRFDLMGDYCVIFAESTSTPQLIYSPHNATHCIKVKAKSTMRPKTQPISKVPYSSRPATYPNTGALSTRRPATKPSKKDSSDCKSNRWILQNSNLCFGPESSKGAYGLLTMATEGILKGMKFVHNNGTIVCKAGSRPPSYWGCGEKKVSVVVTDHQRTVIMPDYVRNYGWYDLPGYTSQNKTLVLINGMKRTYTFKGQIVKVYSSYNHYYWSKTGQVCAQVYAMFD